MAYANLNCSRAFIRNSVVTNIISMYITFDMHANVQFKRGNSTKINQVQITCQKHDYE